MFMFPNAVVRHYLFLFGKNQRSFFSNVNGGLDRLQSHTRNILLKSTKYELKVFFPKS